MDLSAVSLVPLLHTVLHSLSSLSPSSLSGLVLGPHSFNGHMLSFFTRYDVAGLLLSAGL